jgi:hypothetical protein
MVRGSGWSGSPGGTSGVPGAACQRRKAVWWGLDERVGRPPGGDDPECSLAPAASGRTVGSMQLIAPPRADRHLFHIVSGTLLGAIFVAVGLSLAFLVIDTPMVSQLVPASRPNSSQVMIAMLVWALSLIAGGALLAAGTNRLAATVASVRSRGSRLSPVVRALRHLPAEVVVATGVVPRDGRPIPELVVGPFGVAVVHQMASRDAIRAVGQSWEARTQDGWIPTEHPLDRVARDADRVRHWLGDGDLDFVVRVYAALVTPDTSLVRSPACAVITPEQIPAWIEALPRQRSLSAGRRHHLLARVREAVVDKGARRSW